MKNNDLINDLTVGSVPRQLIAFSIPLFFSGLLQTVYSMVDMIIVGNVVGSSGLAAVSIGGDLLLLLTFIAVGFSNAGQIIISQYVGAGQRDKIGEVVGTLFTLLMGCAVFLTVLCLFLYPRLLGFLNTPPEAWNQAADYIVTCICGLVFIYGYNLVSAIMRGMGDSKRPFLFIGIASVLNVILDLVFVAGMGMGAFGAALGTVIGQAVSFLFALRVFYRAKEHFCFDFRLKSFRIYPEVAGPLFALGIPMVIQSAAINFSKLVVNSWINSYGVTAVAVTGIGHKLELVLNVICQASSSAGGAMTAQNIGAGKFKRVPQILGITLLIMMVPGTIMMCLTAFFTKEVFSLFTGDADVLAMSAEYVPIAILLYLGCVLRAPSFSLINGSGNSRLNLAVALLDGIVARIGIAMLLGIVMGMGVHGFWYGNAVSGTVPFAIGGIYYLTGKWKKKRGIIDKK